LGPGRRHGLRRSRCECERKEQTRKVPAQNQLAGFIGPSYSVLISRFQWRVRDGRRASLSRGPGRRARRFCDEPLAGGFGVMEETPTGLRRRRRLWRDVQHCLRRRRRGRGRPRRQRGHRRRGARGRARPFRAFRPATRMRRPAVGRAARVRIMERSASGLEL
jgi:hypothetical protein